mmetsp:Transcript_19979/g.32775  ORF Transcript_19979/g.32775 Transcript_19979/m.32775 type:complete len:111 (-) Transcript_19979:968-1300(-)
MGADLVLGTVDWLITAPVITGADLVLGSMDWLITAPVITGAEPVLIITTAGSETGGGKGFVTLLTVSVVVRPVGAFVNTFELGSALLKLIGTKPTADGTSADGVVSFSRS